MSNLPSRTTPLSNRLTRASQPHSAAEPPTPATSSCQEPKLRTTLFSGRAGGKGVVPRKAEMPALAAATAGSAFPTRPAGRPPVRSGYPTARAHPGPLLGSGRQGQRCRRAAKEVTQEVQGRTPLLPAGPPHRHQDRLRPRASPGPVAAPHLAQDDPEADGQLGPPVGRVQARLTQEREQVAPVSPQVLGQALVSRVRLGREDQ